MSTKITTILTLLAVTAHVLLGCCCHHAHESDSMSVLTSECECRVGTSESEPAGEHDHRGEHDSCDGVDCNFYSAKNSELELFVSKAVYLPATDDCGYAFLLKSVRRTQLIEYSGHCSLPEPLHALKQVWLI